MMETPPRASRRRRLPQYWSVSLHTTVVICTTPLTVQSLLRRNAWSTRSTADRALHDRSERWLVVHMEIYILSYVVNSESNRQDAVLSIQASRRFNRLCYRDEVPEVDKYTR